MIRGFFLALLVFFLPALSLVAEEEADTKIQEGWRTSRSAAGQMNPLGLSIDLRLFYVWPLYGEKRGLLWDNCRVEAGLHNSLTPAFDTLSAFVRVEPVAFFDVSAQAGLRGYYDTFGFGYTPLAGYGASWDSRDRKDAERSTATGFRYSFTATLKGAAGPFVFASATSCTIYDMFETSGGLDYYYDPSADTALRRFDGFITNDSLVLYTFAEGLQGGLVHGFLYVPGSEYVSRRLCLLGRIEGKLNPSCTAFAAVLGGVFLRDRYNSWKDGRLYAAVQAGINVKLGG
ncbi:MAG: hypothetical protein LBT68_03550 [Spirochaetales bacterium]|jgi:hypothetical protein|nr:hypothetical protein [Spirochaetales bacterium]